MSYCKVDRNTQMIKKYLWMTGSQQCLAMGMEVSAGNSGGYPSWGELLEVGDQCLRSTFCHIVSELLDRDGMVSCQPGSSGGDMQMYMQNFSRSSGNRRITVLPSLFAIRAAGKPHLYLIEAAHRFSVRGRRALRRFKFSPARSG